MRAALLCAAARARIISSSHAHARSEREVTRSALMACARRWPHVFEGLTPEEEQRVDAGMRAVRPVLVRCVCALCMRACEASAA